MVNKCILRPQPFKMEATQGMSVHATFLSLCHDHIPAVSMIKSWTTKKRAIRVHQRRKQLFFMSCLYSNALRSPTNSPPGGAVNHDASSSTASSPLAVAGSTPAPSSTAPSASPKPEAAKSSGSSTPSPSHSPSVKANSVARDISSGAVVGIMIAVGLTSILVSLVV